MRQVCGQVIERVLPGRRVACRLYWGRGGPNSLFGRMRNVGVSQRGRESKRKNIYIEKKMTLPLSCKSKGVYL